VTATSKPLITNAGNAVTLADGNTIDGLTISNPSGIGITGTSVNTLIVGSSGVPAAATVTITGAAGGAFALSGNGNGAIAFAAAVTNSSNRSISIQNRTGGTVAITQPVSDTGTGVLLNTNTNATITFSGGLSLNTGANAAFTATGGGTVEVCDENPCAPASTGSLVNTLTTTTGTALNVANTNIGPNNLEFRSITAGTAASGPVNGIALNTTGGSGGLKVKGTGSAGTGGTIQKATGPGVLLMSTSNVSLNSVNILNGTDDGIHGESVNNLDLIGCNLTTNGNSTLDDGIQLGLESGNTVGVTGTVNFTNTVVSGSAHNNVHVRNTSGTLTAFNVTGGGYNNLNDTTGANAFLFEASGTSVTTAGTISGTTFSANSPQRALEVQSHDTATITLFTVTGCTFTDNGIHASFTQDTASNFNVHVLNNTMTAANPLQAINVFSSSTSTGGTLNAIIQGNIIGNAAVIGSGSSTGSGIRVLIQGRTASKLLIDGNTIRQTPKARGIDMQFIGSTTTGLGIVSTNDVTVTNNDVATNGTPADFPLAAIFLAADNQGSPARVRADVRLNTVPAASNTFDYPTFDGTAAQFVYEELTGGTAELVDNPPASASATAEMQSHNTGAMFADPGVALIPGPITTPP